MTQLLADIYTGLLFVKQSETKLIRCDPLKVCLLGRASE